MNAERNYFTKYRARILEIIAFLMIWSFLYSILNKMGIRSPWTLSFTPPIVRFPWLYQPWMAVIYVFGGAASFFLPFIIHWSTNKYNRVFLSYCLVSMIAFIVYLVLPFQIARPEYFGGGIGLSLMRGVASIDKQSNLLPSFHTILAVLCILYAMDSRVSAWIKSFIWVIGIGICFSTIAVGQHYFMDVLAGILAAFIGFYAAKSILKKTL